MKDTTDIWFCAFLLYKEKDIKKYIKIGRGRVRCYFDISEEDWQELKLEFNNSELVKFKGLIDRVKDLAY